MDDKKHCEICGKLKCHCIDSIVKAGTLPPKVKFIGPEIVPSGVAQECLKKPNEE